MDKNSVVRGVDGIYSFQYSVYDQADDEEQLAAAIWIDSEMEGPTPRGYIYLLLFRFNQLLLKAQRKRAMSHLLFYMNLHHPRFSILNFSKSRYPQRHTPTLEQ